MKLTRIDHIAQNGGDGEHYKYEEMAGKIMNILDIIYQDEYDSIKKNIIKILVEAFPNDN